MADDTRKREEHSADPATEAALSARLRHLGEGLDRAGVGRPVDASATTRGQSDGTAMARGLRMSAELVGGVIVGVGLGLGFDYLLGTRPWGFVAFLFLGFAGGVMSVMRSAGVIPSAKR